MMPFETQKKNSSVDKSPSIKQNNKNEIDLVNKKVVKTKQEIEHLKLELQKLINTGLCSENENPTKADVKQVEQLSCNGQQPPVNNTDCDIDKRNDEKCVTAQRENILLKYNRSNNLPKTNQIPSNITTRFNYISLRKCNVSNNENNKVDRQKKKIEYNKEKAREYIKKQREKRAEQMKAKIKETQNEIDLRKKKLKELHEKSLQLVSKNVKQKRKRTQSCEKNGTASENKQPSTCENNLVCNLLSGVSNTVGCDVEESNHNFNNEDRKLSTESLSYKNLSEKTTEPRYSLNRKINGLTQHNSHSESHCNADTELLESNVNRDQLLCKAATKIQAYFRAFRQKKLYKSILTIQQIQNLKQENVIQTNDDNLEKLTPDWLEVPATLPYPYNFINAVKKKLSYAVNKKINERKDFSEFSKSKENIAVSDSSQIKRNSENLTSKPGQTVENSENQELFNEEFETINHIEAVPSNFQEIELSENNITFCRNRGISIAQPLDLHINLSEDLINKTNSSNDRYDLKSFLSNKCLDLDLQTIKPLSLKPLQIDSQYFNKNAKQECTSDSDTSKNIPDISTESSVHTRISKQVLSSNSSDSSNKTDDYNLVCNPERHNNLRRSRQRKLTNTGESIQTLLPYDKDEIVNELGVNCTISQYSSSLSEGQRKPFTLMDTISHTNESNTAKNVRGLTCNTEATCSEKEDIGNTTMLSSFVSYMQCLGVETYSKSNVENETGSERNKCTTASLINSKCKEIKLTEDQSKCFSEIEERKYSSDFESLSADKLNFVPSLKCPSVTLNTSHLSLHKTNDQIAHLQVPFNQTFQFEQPKTIDTKTDSKEIHLKFEAEIRLLHHFNKSLQEAVEKEKSLLENHYVPNNKNRGDNVVKANDSNNVVTSKTKNNVRIGTINYSRGSDVLNSCEPVFTTSSTPDMFENSFFSNTNLHLSSVRDISESDNPNNSSSTILTLKKQQKDHLYPGLSLEMFDQLIKDEDARIENLKTILKIREKSLLDRTKSELAWLEIQKRYLKDSGQLNEISMIKKKQRGLLVKLQHERHEMQRLKQMQKAASKERKTRLRQQRNMIKAQLSTNSETVSKLKSLSRERRHSSGPLKVVGVYRYNESIMSETSPFPKKDFAMSDDNGMISLSRSSQTIASSLLTDGIVTSPNLDFSNDSDTKQQEFKRNKNEHLKRSLLMRETALQKRRKVAEELLQWHQRLVEEERQIAELESAANSIISQVTANPCFSVQNESSSPNFTFKGCQLNVMWQNMTGRQGQRFNDNELYIMSNEAIQQFCKDAKESNEGNFNRNISNSDNNLKVDNNLQNQENDESEFNSLTISSTSLTKSEEVTEKIIEQVENIPNETRKNGEANQTSYSEDFENNSLSTFADFAPTTQNEIKLECMPQQNVNICCKNGSTVDVNELKTATSDISLSIQSGSIENIPSDNFLPPEGNFSCNDSISGLKNECLEINRESASIETLSEISDNTKTEKKSRILNKVTSSTLASNPSRCEEDINGECSEVTSSNSVEHLSNHVDYNNESKKIIASVTSSIPDVIDKVSAYENMASDSLSSVQNEIIFASEVVEVSKITEMPDILHKTCVHEETNVLPTTSEIIFKDEKGDLSASEVDFSLAIADTIQLEHSLELKKDLSACKNLNNYFYVSTSDIVMNDKRQVPTSQNKEIETEKSANEPQTNNKKMKNENVTGQFESSSILVDVAEKNEEDNIQKEAESDKKLLNKYKIKPLRNVSTKEKIMSEEVDIKKNFIYSLDTIKNNDDSENIVGTNDLEKEGNCDYKNVRKRIFEILTDANVSRNEPNSQLQNLHPNASNTPSPSSLVVSPESEILLLDKQILSKHTFANEEEEELVKKQLAIEQEIKQIEQQQKEHLPYLYLREIPNKPPPPYMPPAPSTTVPSVLPSSAEQVNLIVHHISNYLFNAHLNGTLPNISLLPEIKRQMQGQIEPPCQRFIFDLCKELTVEHYKQFEEESGPSWMRITKRPKLAFQKAFDERTLEKFLMKKVKETLGYEKIDRKESMIIKWSRKKRDHVDELLVLESQNEEAEWTNYDKDELIVINELTNEIVNSLIGETLHILQDILAKRSTSPN